MSAWIRFPALTAALIVLAAATAPVADAFALQPHEVKRHVERANRQAVEEAQQIRQRRNPKPGGANPAPAPAVDPQAAADANEAAAIAKLQQRRDAEAARKARQRQQFTLLGATGALLVLACGGIFYLRRKDGPKARRAPKAAAGKGGTRRPLATKGP